MEAAAAPRASALPLALAAESVARWMMIGLIITASATGSGQALISKPDEAHHHVPVVARRMR